MRLWRESLASSGCDLCVIMIHIYTKTCGVYLLSLALANDISALHLLNIVEYPWNKIELQVNAPFLVRRCLFPSF